MALYGEITALGRRWQKLENRPRASEDDLLDFGIQMTDKSAILDYIASEGIL